MQDLEEASSVVNYGPQKTQSPTPRFGIKDESGKNHSGYEKKFFEKKIYGDTTCFQTQGKYGSTDKEMVAYCSVLSVLDTIPDFSSSSVCSASSTPKALSLGCDSPSSLSSAESCQETDLLLSCDDAASDEYWNHVQELPGEHQAVVVVAAAAAAAATSSGADDSAPADACWLPAPSRPDWSELFRSSFPDDHHAASLLPDCADPDPDPADGPAPAPAPPAQSDEELIALLAGCAGSTPPAAAAAAATGPIRFGSAAPPAAAPWAWGGPGLFAGN
jgi:hypothetical protein